MSRRLELKRKVAEILQADQPQEKLLELHGISQRRLLSTLLLNLNGGDQTALVRAAALLGLLVEDWIRREGEAGREQGREAMRRLVWSLNEESGSIGWGSPLAMAEIMSRDQKLAGEFVNILVSYITDGGNFLEYEPLQRSVLWGLGHLAQKRPDLLNTISLAPQVALLLRSPDAGVRGAAAHVLGFLPGGDGQAQLGRLVDDSTEVSVYSEGGLVRSSVGQLARGTLGTQAPVPGGASS